MKIIPLTQGKFAMVDDADFERLNQWKWYANWDGFNWYAKRNIKTQKGKTVLFLHKAVFGPVVDGYEVDHRNGDTLDCRNQSLRQCTGSQNCANRRNHKLGKSGFRGVIFRNGRPKPWIASIGSRSICNYESLGSFKTAIEAAKAYNVAALKRYGEFSILNDLSKYETTEKQTAGTA